MKLEAEKTALEKIRDEQATELSTEREEKKKLLNVLSNYKMKYPNEEQSDEGLELSDLKTCRWDLNGFIYYSEEVNRLITERDSAVSTQKQTEARLEALESELKKQASLLIQTQASLEDSKREVAAERLLTTSSKAEESHLRECVMKLEKDLAVAREDSDHFLEDIQAVKQQSSVLRQRLGETEEQRRSLHEQLSLQLSTSHNAEIEQERMKVLKEAAEQRVAVLEEELKTYQSQMSNTVVKESSQSDKKEENSQAVLEEVSHLRSELKETGKSLNTAQLQIASLRVKESDAARLLAQQNRFEAEISNLHEKLRKQEAAHGETTQKLEGRVVFAEQSLEAYKKEMEVFLKEKLTLEQDSNQAKQKLSLVQSEYDSVCNQLDQARSTIKSYEETITKLQTLEASKDEALLLRVKEVNELNAEVKKVTSEKEMVSQTLQAESIRMQSQMESLNQENGRLRMALEQRHEAEEASGSLLREEEAKLDHWREGLENSYKQKRVLKQAMRQMMEESATQREQLNRECRSRRALEREMMRREDIESYARQASIEESSELEFGSFDWARRVRN